MKNISIDSVDQSKGIVPFRLENAGGMQLEVINYGGIISKLLIPKSDSGHVDVVLGYDSINSYVNDKCFMGCLIGRVAGRITGASFTLEGNEYQLTANDAKNHLHGGSKGFDKRIWDVDYVFKDGRDVLMLSYTSADGEEGYPGELDVKVFYSLGENNELKIDYEARCSKATPVSLTNHSYFNLAGGGTALDHELQILSDQITGNDEEFTLSDQKQTVDGHSADFRNPILARDRIPNLEYKHGANYWINHESNGSMDMAAVFRHSETNREMIVYTDAPCMQYYTGLFLESESAKNGGSYKPYDGMCFECHEYPNGVNALGLDSSILQPGELYRQTTIYKFQGF